MRPGRMDRYITITRKTLTVDSYGASIPTWATITHMWAEKRELRMNERLQAGQVEADISARYLVRYTTAINEKDRIVDGSDTYEILGVVEIVRKKGLELIAGTI